MFGDREFEQKTLKNREFLEFRWCWSAIALEKYNTRFRADTSDRSHLQKCSPNVVCYFWRSCLTSYSCKSRFFSTFTLLISLTFTVPILYSTQTIAKSLILSLPREGYILKRGPNSSQLHRIVYRHHTEYTMRKPQTALTLPENF